MARATRLRRYSVKFVCGKSEGKILARGHYFTAINVHNPSTRPVKIRKTISTALPGETAGHVVQAGISELGPNESFEIDCQDIYRHARMSGCWLKGFVILESRTPLEVVAVYTASGADKEVETLHIERVPAFEPGDDEDEGPLPDLVPITPFPTHTPGLPHGFCQSRVELGIIVRNLGPGNAPASKVRVEFLDCNEVAEENVPALPAGTDSPPIVVPIPPQCWIQATLKFRITANSSSAFPEVTLANNTVEESCKAD